MARDKKPRDLQRSERTHAIVFGAKNASKLSARNRYIVRVMSARGRSVASGYLHQDCLAKRPTTTNRGRLLLVGVGLNDDGTYRLAVHDDYRISPEYVHHTEHGPSIRQPGE